MSESEIRAILRQVCERLARQVVVPVGKVAVPMALGAALSAGTGCFSDGSNSVLLYAAPDALYMAPDYQVVPDGGHDAASDLALKDLADPGAVPLYMATDLVEPPDAAYMGPDPGPVPEYMAVDAVDPDPGVQPPYMAPDVPQIDPGPVPEYMAVDAGETDPGALPPYMAPS